MIREQTDHSLNDIQCKIDYKKFINIQITKSNIVETRGKVKLEVE